MNALEKPVRVLVVDDSALVRRVVTESLSSDPDIEVVGTASDPYIARDKILELDPDVMTLDIEMPRMDGLTFLKVIMRHHPMPVIVMSTLTSAGSAAAFEALQAGAIDLVEKPSNVTSIQQAAFELAEKVKAAAGARVSATPPETGTPSATDSTRPAPQRPAMLVPSNASRRYLPRQVILIGASTGGTEALKEILTVLPEDLPGIAIVQHIPARFSAALAQRLNEQCRIEVREARNGDRMEPGVALIAPGGYHIVLKWAVDHYEIQTNEGPPVHHQRPAVDVLFESAVKCGAGPHALGIVLTGMGADGAAGLLSLRQAGATTIAQNEETCVVFGMPREAIRLGAAQHIVPLEHIAGRIHFHGNTVALGSRPR